MDQAQHYREQAEHCLHLARLSDDIGIAAALETLANDFLEVAQEFELRQLEIRRPLTLNTEHRGARAVA
jgi:hypothetical protein